MLTRTLFFFALLGGGTVFLTGAWFGSFAPSAQNPESFFTPQNVPLDADIVGSGVDANQLLEKAMEKLAPARTGWLKTKIRQTMNDADSRFVAAGFLQRGPNHCARLEMDVITGQAHGRLVIVSDGELLAQVRKLPGREPAVVLEDLPAATEKTPALDPAAQEEYLVGKGCGGPRALLRQFRQHLRNGKLQTGLLHDKPVIRIKGDIDPATVPAFAPNKKRLTLIACTYLDATTLWPHRFEWREQSKVAAARPILQIDLHDFEIGRELSFAECTHVFSYQPGGNERVTGK